MTIRYWGIDDLNAPAGAPDTLAFEGVCKGEFTDDKMLVEQFRWNEAMGVWSATQIVGDWYYMGNAWLTEIDEARAMAWIEARKVLNADGSLAEGVRLNGIAEHLMNLPDGEPWILDFNFGRWQAASGNDEIVGFCQVLREDANHWWVEFSSDEFNNPKLTDQQRAAILEAGFAEPNEETSPNYWLFMEDPNARGVVELVERVLTNGGFAE